MGCDGGTIPRRDELVRLKKKQETKDKDAELAFQWRCCHLSQQLLQFPIVMCGLGYLYNKVSIIEELLNRANASQSISHVKSLKDIKTLNFTPHPEYKVGANKNDGAVDERVSPFICPVTRIEVSGKHRFVALWSCGCVFSERALKEVNTNICHKCQKPFNNEDVVILNGNDQDITQMTTNMEKRQQKNKKEKKKKEIKVETVTASTSEVVKSEPSTSAAQKSDIKTAGTSAVQKSDIKTVGTSTVQKSDIKTVGTSAAPKIEIKTVGGLLQMKRASSDDALQTKAKKVKKDYSIAKDPNASEVYKSLFTTHASEQQQTRAHWITYNPFYN